MPVVNGLEDEYAEAAIAFIRVDANSVEGGALQSSYNLRGHPSIVIVDEEGNAVEKYVGAQSAETLRPVINSVLK